MVTMILRWGTDGKSEATIGALLDTGSTVPLLSLSRAAPTSIQVVRRTTTKRIVNLAGEPVPGAGDYYTSPSLLQHRKHHRGGGRRPLHGRYTKVSALIAMNVRMWFSTGTKFFFSNGDSINADLLSSRKMAAGNHLQGPMVMRSHWFLLHMVTTFSATDQKRQGWLIQGRLCTSAKKQGKGIMVSGFLTSGGRFRVPYHMPDSELLQAPRR